MDVFYWSFLLSITVQLMPYSIAYHCHLDDFLFAILQQNEHWAGQLINNDEYIGYGVKSIIIKRKKIKKNKNDSVSCMKYDDIVAQNFSFFKTNLKFLLSNFCSNRFLTTFCGENCDCKSTYFLGTTSIIWSS